MERKVILIGSSSVGKTSLINRLIDDSFDDNHLATVGPAFYSHEITLENGQTETLQIWDTAGQEKYFSIAKQFFREANIALICFDYTDSSSVEAIQKWKDSILDVEPNCIIYLVATKLDLITDTTELEAFLDKMTKEDNQISKSFVTSSRTGLNVAEVFKEAAREEINQNNTKTTQKLKPLKEEKKDGCC